jgi:chromosome segregation ATPase
VGAWDEQREEINRLRDRAHASANATIGLQVQVEELGNKMDAIHLSLKDDLEAINEEQKRTNGRVSNHERDLSRIQGALAVLVAALPFLLFGLEQLLHA